MNEKEKLLAILRDICPDAEIDESSALIDDGILESLDLVALVTELMAEFQVEIGVDDLLPENFNTVDDILRLIHSGR